jgi:hypothetical protein
VPVVAICPFAIQKKCPGLCKTIQREMTENFGTFIAKK